MSDTIHRSFFSKSITSWDREHPGPPENKGNYNVRLKARHSCSSQIQGWEGGKKKTAEGPMVGVSVKPCTDRINSQKRINEMSACDPKLVGKKSHMLG